jgi:hypothetical protein
MKYLGIDLHSNRFTCCMIDEDGSKDKFTFDIDMESLNKFISRYNKGSSFTSDAPKSVKYDPL